MNQENKCPICGAGEPGHDPLCSEHAKDYLGTHYGYRNDTPEEYKKWCNMMREEYMKRKEKKYYHVVEKELKK